MKSAGRVLVLPGGESVMKNNMELTHTVDDNYAYGEMIKRLRIENGLTQLQVAKELNVTPGYICNVENGRTSMSLRMLMYYAKVLNRSLDSLVGELDPDYAETSIDREILEEVSKLDVQSKKKLLKTLKVWTN